MVAVLNVLSCVIRDLNSDSVDVLSMFEVIMVVLSLFDGMSCGMLALKRAGIQVDSYFASEIDKYAVQVSKKNWSEIDSPCVFDEFSVLEDEEDFTR